LEKLYCLAGRIIIAYGNLAKLFHSLSNI